MKEMKMRYRKLKEDHIVKIKLDLLNKEVPYLIKKVHKKEKSISVRKIVDNEPYPSIPYVVKIPFQMILDVKDLTKRELLMLMDKDYLLNTKTFKSFLNTV
jgi:hypothetical protein